MKRKSSFNLNTDLKEHRAINKGSEKKKKEDNYKNPTRTKKYSILQEPQISSEIHLEIK